MLYLDGADVGPELVHVHLCHVPVGSDVDDGAVVDFRANLGQNNIFLLFTFVQ